MELIKLDKLYLNKSTTASQYISDFISSEMKLSEIKYIILLAILRNKFLNYIIDLDYSMIVQILRTKNPPAHLMSYIKEIRYQED